MLDVLSGNRRRGLRDIVKQMASSGPFQQPSRVRSNEPGVIDKAGHHCQGVDRVQQEEIDLVLLVGSDWRRLGCN